MSNDVEGLGAVGFDLLKGVQIVGVEAVGVCDELAGIAEYVEAVELVEEAMELAFLAVDYLKKQNMVKRLKFGGKLLKIF